ncbi:MAG: SusC/RagA family TonB-linked outer membrane protein [Bacteroidetes bacterium]|nr:MAG: SusC/RagA family TonB-linked outer membrane protein [Bacteroidota bacterium]
MKQRILAMLLFGLLGITPALAQEREITGKVTDSKGEAIPGVAVLVVETNSGNATDIDGNFKVKASTGNTLRFSYVNFKTKEVKVGSETNLQITLEDDNVLTDVIVTGYRNEKAETFSGSAGRVGAKAIEQVPIASFDQVLIGRTPGLQGGAGSGQPGSSANITIRGAGSITGSNTPLYVIDGVPVAAGDFSALNANDFESVTVLKDAASTSKYGSRGANGVIVVKTKSGKSGTTQLNYRFQQGYTTRTTSKFSNMNTSQRLEFERMLTEHDVANNTNLFFNNTVTNANANPIRTAPFWKTWILAGSPTSGLAYSNLQSQLAPFRDVDTDWSKEFFRTGQIQSHDLSAVGGNEKTNFFISTQYRREEGIINKSNLDRYTLRANIQHNATEKFRFGLQTSFGYANSSLVASETGNSLFNPVFGSYLSLPYYTPETDKTRFLNDINPVIAANVFTRKNNGYKFVSGLYLEYDFTKNLSFRTNWGGDLAIDVYSATVLPTDAQNQGAINQRGNQGRMGKEYTLVNSFVGTNSLTYRNTFGEGNKHDITASANFEIVARRLNGFGYTAYGVNPKFGDSPGGFTQGTTGNGFIAIVGNADGVLNDQGFNTANRLASVFADASYTYNGKYTLAAGIRRDGSSRFGENNRYGLFYNVGGTWNLDKESFMENIANIVSDAKVRMTYGQQGNQTFGTAVADDFRYFSTFAATGGYAGVAGIAPSSPANPDVKWESQAIYNIGLDFGLFKNRITGTIEYYSRKTKDLFLDAQVTRTTGFNSVTRNVGTMRNRGLELNLSADVLKLGKSFVWNVNVIHTINRNKIIDLGGEPEYVLGTSIVRVGIPYGSHYVVGWAGVNPSNGDPLYYDKENNVTPNYNANNNQAFGTWVAPVFGSFTNTFSYKGLELSVFFIYEMEKQLFNNQTFFNQNVLSFPVARMNKDERLLNAWTTPGQVTDIPRLNAARQFSSRDLEDASFLRLRNITLAYNVPTNWLKNMKIRTLRTYISGQNVLTFSKFTGFDPEDSNNIQLSQYPVPRVFTFGFDLGF